MRTGVAEITEFVNRGEILGGLRGHNPTWLVLTDWSAASQWAYSQDPPSPTIWVDLRENESAPLVGSLYREFADQRAEHRRLTEEYRRTLVQRLRRTPTAAIMDDVIVDLGLGALNRMLGGSIALFEEIFGGYRAGGWPCGWDGDYPVGRLVVFDGQPG